MRFDFDKELFVDDGGEVVRVKFPLGVSIIFVTFSSFSILGTTFFLCLISEIKIIKIITAKIAPLAIAMSSMSPCDFPSMETF